jgi:hypothetical protein
MPGMTPPTTAAPEFMELVCADQDLLLAEFEAIVAANFPPSPPGDQLVGGKSGAFKIPDSFGWPGVNDRATRNSGYAISSLRRQRSPPVSALLMRLNSMGSAEQDAEGR